MSEPPAPPTRRVPLRDWRRLDWRFLLPSGIERIGYLGSAPPEELAALGDAGLELVVHPSPQSRAEVVILVAPSRELLPRAVDGLEPGGWVLIRLGGGGGRAAVLRPFRRRVWSRRLRSYGFTEVRAYWHAPDYERCAYIVRIDDRIAVTAMLRRFHGVPLGLPKSLVGRLLNAARLVELAARDVTLAARFPGRSAGVPAPASMPFQPPASELPHPARGSDASTLLMTPWFEASRHVVALYAGRNAHLRAVAKLPRRAWDTGGIDTEAAALELVRSSVPSVADNVPVVLRHEPEGPRPYLLESALLGTAVGPAYVRRNTARVLDSGYRLLERLAVGGDPAARASFDRLIGAPLARVEECLPDAQVQELVASTRRLLEPLRTASLPAVLEHGDFGHPNLLLSGRRGDMAALDWERFEPTGLPALDLVFFLQYVQECRAAAVTVERHRRAFDTAFVGADAWASGPLHRYADRLGVTADLLPHLVLAAWARVAALLVGRLQPGAGSSPLTVAPSHLVDTVVADRDFQLWRHAVSRFPRVLA